MQAWNLTQTFLKRALAMQNLKIIVVTIVVGGRHMHRNSLIWNKYNIECVKQMCLVL